MGRPRRRGEAQDGHRRVTREVENASDSFPSTKMRWTVWFDATGCSSVPNLTGIADADGLGAGLGEFDVTNLPNNEGIYAVGTFGGGLFYMVPETTVRDSSFQVRSQIDFQSGDCIQSNTDGQDGSSLEVVFAWGVLNPPFTVVP